MISQRHALGLLFVVFVVGFAFVAIAAAKADEWVIGAASGALGAWMATLAVKLLRPR